MRRSTHGHIDGGQVLVHSSLVSRVRLFVLDINRDKYSWVVTPLGSFTVSVPLAVYNVRVLRVTSDSHCGGGQSFWSPLWSFSCETSHQLNGRINLVLLAFLFSFCFCFGCAVDYLAFGTCVYVCLITAISMVIFFLYFVSYLCPYYFWVFVLGERRLT